MNVAAHLLDTFEAQGRRTAIIDARGAATTFHDLIGRVGAVRSMVRRLRLAPQARVVLQTAAGVDFTVAAIALLAEELVPVGIEMAQGDAVYLDRARSVGASAVIQSSIVKTLHRIDPIRRRLDAPVPPKLDLPTISLPKNPEPAPVGSLPAVDSEAPAIIVFTGGTTDRPKAVELSHRAVLAYFQNLATLPEWERLDSIVADHPQQVIYGLAHGKTVHLSTNRSDARAAHVADLLFRDGVDGYFGSPSTWKAILEERRPTGRRTTPKAILLGGAPVTRLILERLERDVPDVPVRCLYGMTEMGLVAHISGREKLALLRSDGDRGGDPIGRLVAGVQASVSDDDELMVVTTARFTRYVGEQPCTPDTPFATGDLASMAGDDLTLIGRKKDMIVRRGVNLYCGQYEPRLLELCHRGRRAFDAAALVRSVAADGSGDESFALAYVPADPSSISDADASRLVSTVLPAIHGPVRAVRLESMPTTGRQNKLDRSALESLVAERSDSSPSAPSITGPGAGSHSGPLAELRNRMRHDVARRTPGSVRRIALGGLTDLNVAMAEHHRRRSTDHPLHHDPIFVLGHQRSGTTTMHRALCALPQSTGLSLLDMVAPHPIGWWSTRALRTPAQSAERRQRKSDLGDRHHLGLVAPEEDEFLLAALGLSAFLPSAFPETLGDEAFDHYRDRAAWPRQTIDELIAVYDDTVRSWRAHHHVPDSCRMVAKNPAFGPIADRLWSRYPSSTFVVMLRDPVDAVTSRLDLVQSIHGRPLDANEISVLVNDSLRQLEGLAVALDAIPPDRVLLVPFESFVDDQLGWVRRAAVSSGLPVPFLPLVPADGPLTTHRPRQLLLADFGREPEEIESAVPRFQQLREANSQILSNPDHDPDKAAGA